MAFSHARNPLLVNCSFSEHYGDRITITQSRPNALQILWDAVAPGAAFNSEERYPHPRCLPRTRVDSIQNIQNWADNGASSMLWLHGPAGAGKSAVAQTICESWAEKNRLLASFFFSQSSASRGTVERFVLTLAYQAVFSMTGKLDLILDVVEKNPQVLKLDMPTQLRKLMIEPLLIALQSPPATPEGSHPSLIVIDAVDECVGSDNQLRLLSTLLSLVTSEESLPVRILVVSRPEPHIRHAFSGFLKAFSTIESMYGAMDDVYKYLDFRFEEIHDSEKHSDIMQYVTKPWPGPTVLHELTFRSGGYFIYASTVVRYVDEEGYVCTDRLEEVMNPNARVPGSHPYMELDKVYSQILSTARNVACLTRILGCIVIGRRTIVGFDPLAPIIPTSTIINALFSFRPGELKMTLRGLHSLIAFSENDRDDIRFYHASFSDYLLDGERSEGYHINYDVSVQDIYTSSLRLIQLPAIITSFVPSNEWAVATLTWTRLGCPANRLLEYFITNEASATILLKQAVAWSKEWHEDMQFRLICAFCNMIMLLKDCSSLQNLVLTLTQLCQLTVTYYFLPLGNAKNLRRIQDIRTLLEMDPLKERSWHFQRATITGILKLTPAERPFIERFLSSLSYLRDPIWQWSLFRVVTNIEGGKWSDSKSVFEEIFWSFLDDRTIWGRDCEPSTGQNHLLSQLAGSSRWADLSKPKLATPSTPHASPATFDLDSVPLTYGSPTFSPLEGSSDVGDSSGSDGEYRGHFHSTVESRKEATRRQRIEATQRRSDEIRDAYTNLKGALPVIHDNASKIAILTAATETIIQRAQKNTELEDALKRLQAEYDRLHLQGSALNQVLPAAGGTLY